MDENEVNFLLRNKLKTIVGEVVNKAVDPIKEDLKSSHEELKNTVERRVLPSVIYSVKMGEVGWVVRFTSYPNSLIPTFICYS